MLAVLFWFLLEQFYLTNSELLAAGLLVSPAIVKVFKGTTYMVNVGTTETLLYPRTRIGVLSHVHIMSLPAGITEVVVGTFQ